jgi:hypothetical protein
METTKDAQQETKITPQEMPIAPSVATMRRIGEDTIPSKRTFGSSVWVIFEAGDPLAEGFEESGKEFAVNRRGSKVAASRLPRVHRIGRLEESLYWLFSAAVLGYLLLEIIGR